MAKSKRTARPAGMVAVFHMGDPHPVFHLFGRHERTTDGDGRHNGWQHRTRCGRLTADAWWVPGRTMGEAATDYRTNEYATRVRLDHARLIGRPCAICFPEEADHG